MLFASCTHGQTRQHEEPTEDTLTITDTTLFFFHSEGCQECLEAKTTIQRWLLNHPSVVVQPIDVDSTTWDAGLLKRYGVERIPTLVLLAPGGKVLDNGELEDALHGLKDSPDNTPTE